jgi:LCP family protein required for cell wall assembly
MKLTAVCTAVLLAAALTGCGSKAGASGGEEEAQAAVVSTVTGDGEAVDEGLGEDTPLAGTSVLSDTNANLGAVEFDGNTYEPKDSILNILLLGIDSDSDRVKNSAGWRSDMIVLVTIDYATNKITCTSVPRDTRAKVYQLDNNGNVTSEKVEKLNHAYAYGGGPTKFSAENAMRATAELLECDGLIHVPINYYISIDLDGLPRLADALDGVEVTLDQNVPDVGKRGETVDLTGSKVRKFLENRHDMDDGEMSRQKHEQDFIKSMAAKIKSMGAAAAAPGLYETFIKFMRTNMELDTVLEVAAALDNANIDDMAFNLMEEAQPEVINGVWYLRASQNEILHQMLDAMYTRA